MSIIVVGCDEFIGYHLCEKLLQKGEVVWGFTLDADDDKLQEQRLKRLKKNPNANHFNYLGEFLDENFSKLADVRPPCKIVFAPELSHIALIKAQTLADTFTMLALCNIVKPSHVVALSSSEVYFHHHNTQMQVNESANHPQNLEAATCRAMELLFHGLAADKGVPCSIVRMFEYYGPLAPENNLISDLQRKISEDLAINLSELSNDYLDFVHVNDATDGIMRILEHAATGYKDWDLEMENSDRSLHPWTIHNLGTGLESQVIDVINLIAKLENKTPKLTHQWAKSGRKIVADITKLTHETGFLPKISLSKGLKEQPD